MKVPIGITAHVTEYPPDKARKQVFAFIMNQRDATGR